MKKSSNAIFKTLLVCFMLLLLVSCAGEGLGASAAPDVSNPEFQRTPPPVSMPEAGGQDQKTADDGSRSAVIDMTNTSKGYVAASCNAPSGAKLRVSGPGGEYDYDLSNTGETEFFPLATGNGTYSFTVFIHLASEPGTLYEAFLEASASVQLENEQIPFLVPNKIVNYTPSSQVVALSHQIAEHASTDLEVVQQIYAWIATNITYDTDKATAVAGASGYAPNLDDTISSKKGICYDYAALAAAMFRANGFPCKLIMGDVTTQEGQTVYHAWNMIWLEEEGFLTVKIPTTPEEWQRLDTTFAASGASDIAEFIGDGTNYVDMFVH